MKTLTIKVNQPKVTRSAQVNPQDPLPHAQARSLSPGLSNPATRVNMGGIRLDIQPVLTECQGCPSKLM